MSGGRKGWEIGVFAALTPLLAGFIAALITFFAFSYLAQAGDPCLEDDVCSSPPGAIDASEGCQDDSCCFLLDLNASAGASSPVLSALPVDSTVLPPKPEQASPNSSMRYPLANLTVIFLLLGMFFVGSGAMKSHPDRG